MPSDLFKDAGRKCFFAGTLRAEADGGSFWWWYAYDQRGLAREVFAQEGCQAGSQESRPQAPEVTFAYNAAGQVEHTTYRGGTSIERTYHVRGWLASVDQLDGSAASGSSYDYFDDGTLERQDWRQTKLGGGAKTYTYSYDALKRLLSADYADNGQGGAYDVASLGYDESGNITALKRRGASGALADDLTYTYGAGQEGRASGRLTSIGDPAGSLQGWDAASGSFDYDRAGRMTEAPAPYEITAARYNERSLPTEHVLATGDTVRYRYSLEGERTYQRSGSGVPTRYLLGEGGANLATMQGGEIEDWNLTLPSGSAIGRVTSSGERRYYLKGHLGSVRTAIDASGAAKEARDYYPFGLRLRTGGEMAAAEDFTGHHLDAATGGLLYAGARYYMSALGRWTAPDPLGDDYPAWNPYNYGMNNPTGLVDPTGMAPTDYYLNLASGEVEHHEGSEDRFDEGLIHLAGDDASVSDITNALDEQGFSYESTRQVDTREQYQGWKMMQIFSPENVAVASGLYFAGTDLSKPRSFGQALGGVGSRSSAESVTLYRAVSKAEYKQIMKTGKLQTTGSSANGKYFAESLNDAKWWGEAMEGAGNYRVIGVRTPQKVANQFHRGRMDGRMARFARMDQLTDYSIIPSP